MKCDDVYQHICENLDQEIDSPRCREIRKHLEQCPDCNAYLDSLRKTVSLYRTATVPPFPKTAERDLFKALDLLTAKRHRRRGKGAPRKSGSPGRRA